MICNRDRAIKHLDLCVMGSEGLRICQQCEIELVHHIQSMMRIATTAKMEGFKQARKKDA